MFRHSLKVIYAVDKGDENWKGDTGFVTMDMIKKYLAPPTTEGKVQILVCGTSSQPSELHVSLARLMGARDSILGPPGQVASIAGPKDGMKQGELKGVLKEIGYSPEQVYLNVAYLV